MACEQACATPLLPQLLREGAGAVCCLLACQASVLPAPPSSSRGQCWMGTPPLVAALVVLVGPNLFGTIFGGGVEVTWIGTICVPPHTQLITYAKPIRYSALYT